MDIDKLAYTPAMLARLAYSHAAFELSERLVPEAATHSDAYGRGAFLTEEALTTFVEAEGLLAAAVIADRMRGASWQAATSGSPGSPAPDECSLRDACDRAQNRPCFPVQTRLEAPLVAGPAMRAGRRAVRRGRRAARCLGVSGRPHAATSGGLTVGLRMPVLQ